MNIVDSTAAYESWLRAQLEGDVVEDDIDDKHAKMAADPFQFLRATYWRWAETIFDVCPKLKDAPAVLAVGDLHIENFGTWRDSEGRLVWGVNDFDEAAKMPYALDLVRLATSAVLAKVRGISPAAICAHIAKGYREGIADPAPYVLDRDHAWLRAIVVVSEDDRTHFWNKFAGKQQKPQHIRARYIKALKAARPDPGVRFEYAPRTAGTGSLGRPRFVGVGTWQGDLIVREAKAIVRSGWTRVHERARRLRCEEIATGEYRCPDPWYCLHGAILVRRLSPNDFKIEVQPKKKKKGEDRRKAVRPAQLVNRRMLHAMGRDLGSVHRGASNGRKILNDLDRHKSGWLLADVTAMARATESEWREWRDAYRKHKHAG